MQGKATSPRILNLSWGRIEVEGQESPFKDAKVYPGGTREWDWNETGTRHVPGIQPEDVKELIDHGAKVIILSRGMYEQLQVCPETLKLLEEKGIQVHILQTEKAVQVYNQLRELEAVGGLFHTTC